VALGIFKMNWPLEHAHRGFVDLMKEAFSPRQMLTIPVIRNMAQLFTSHIYRTSGIEVALQNAFGNTLLFGQSREASQDRVKVAVLATTGAGYQPCLFANYSRKLTGPGMTVK